MTVLSIAQEAGLKAPPRPAGYASVAEAARYCSLSSASIRRAIAAGQLEAHKVMGRVLVSYAALEAFITGKSPDGQDSPHQELHRQ